MKKTLYGLLAGSVLLFASCKKGWFETSPSGSLTGSEIYATTKNIDALLNGTLRYLMETATSQDNPGYGSILLSQEVMGSDAIARDGVYGYLATYGFTDPFDNTTRRALFYWTFQYKVIDNCNGIIENVDNATGTDADKRYLKGQALALRASVYLNLVRQYQFTYAKDKNAKSVPIYTEPTTPSTPGKARATVQEVYDRVLEDLRTAGPLLEGFKRTVKNRPDLNVVNGLAARAFLTMENWDSAAARAKLARTSYPIMEATEYSKGFSDVTNVEWIWGHPQATDQNLGGASFFAYIDVTPATGYRSIMADPNFKAIFDDADVRKKLFRINTDATNALYAWLQYTKFVNKADQSGHIPLMRSSEQLLIEAESKARLNQLNDAVIVLNGLRAKRTLPDLDAANFTQPQLIEEILRERRRELWGEGFELPDLLRLQRAVVRTVSTEKFTVGTKEETVKGHHQLKFPDKSDFVPNSNYYLFSIPFNEINSNPNLN
ncbi:RagB/SusD family nutrient uptake outer membrane protein [uncultured Chitinophaga sp.]|uniref:RagB/SusD family nutrient uptake outer membrane protein n=1 Tax=uncultured Chitinophaga sp. TaxID=339340 RepID=UPI0025DD8BA0|nr:RagB/SusD family nutrient uptake outer membrane protein [uncultured Chitinophaga sp.]